MGKRGPRPKFSDTPKKIKKARQAGRLSRVILTRLQEYPLSAKRIYREIQEKRFTVKYTIVKDYVRKVRPKVGVSAIYRYEINPESNLK